MGKGSSQKQKKCTSVLLQDLSIRMNLIIYALKSSAILRMNGIRPAQRNHADGLAVLSVHESTLSHLSLLLGLISTG